MADRCNLVESTRRSLALGGVLVPVKRKSKYLLVEFEIWLNSLIG